MPSSAEPDARGRTVFPPEPSPAWWGGDWPGGRRLPLHPGARGETGGRLPDTGRPTSQAHAARPRPLTLRLADCTFT